MPSSLNFSYNRVSSWTQSPVSHPPLQLDVAKVGSRSDVHSIQIVALHLLLFCWSVDVRAGAGVAILDHEMEAMY